MAEVMGMLCGFIAWFLLMYGLAGIFTVDQNERAVLTSFGRARRLEGKTTLDDPIGATLKEDQRERYCYPQVQVVPPGIHWKWPWEKVYKITIATQTVNMAFDPEEPMANRRGQVLDAVTKDQLDTGLTGQIRYRVSERNLYAYLFGVKNPLVHVMGFFISVLRERIANFEAPRPKAIPAPALPASKAASRLVPADDASGPESESTDLVEVHPEEKSLVTQDIGLVSGVSINDLRKNLTNLNEHMDQECRSSEARYGMILDASLITGIDPPHEVESALAAINTAHNEVSSDISLAQASADQKIVQSRRSVEIETLKAHAEVEPLVRLTEQLTLLRDSGPGALTAYLRQVRRSLLGRADKVILEKK